MNQDEIKTAMTFLKAQFLEPDDEFSIRKQANSIVAFCFRNTKLEDFHAEGFITDNEMKNVSINSCDRIEYLMNSERFWTMTLSEIFSFAFETPYKEHVRKDLRKPMWRALRKQAEARLSTVHFLKANDVLKYDFTLLGNWSMYARYYNEDIKFDGQHLSRDPNEIAVGHQWANK
jgi:hypothetical protein